MRNLTSILCVLVFATFAFAQYADMDPNYVPSTKIESVLDVPGDVLWFYDVGDSTIGVGDIQLLGAEYVCGNYYVTSGHRAGDPNIVYVFDRTGAAVDSFDQWSSAGWGWRDLAWDGEFLYGSDDQVVDAFELDGTPAPGANITVVGGPTGWFPRAIAYDNVNDTFWGKSFSSNLVEFNRAGTVLSNYVLSLSAYGAAWDNTTGMLWLHATPTTVGSTEFYEIDPATGLATGLSYLVAPQGGNTANIVGGAFYSETWDPNVYVLGALMQGTPDDQIVIVEAETKTYPTVDIAITYISGDPVPAGGGFITLDIDIWQNEPYMVHFDLWVEVMPQINWPDCPNRTFNWPTNHLYRPNMPWPIQAGWPAGGYTMEWSLGDFETQMILAQDSFNFTKSADDDGSGMFVWDPNSDPLDQLFEGMDMGDMATVSEFALAGNYPNPFNPSTTINYTLANADRVKLAVYDLSGREVASLVDGYREAGAHEAQFDASGLASGIYIYRLTSGVKTATGKMILMK